MENNILTCEICLSTDILRAQEGYVCRNCGKIWTDRAFLEARKSNEFKINDYLSLKLEVGKTNIYVKGELFQQCKFLLLNIPFDKISSFNDIDSIDEAAEKLDHSLEGESQKNVVIPPETEFWGHCSNLQVWYENSYDTRLLHSNLAFPLLKKLVEAGDLNAKRVFREEIVKRYIKGNETVQTYLIELNYLNFLKDEEIKQLFMKLINRDDLQGLELIGLYARHLIKYNAEEVIDLLFDSNYEFKNWVNIFLKEGPHVGIFIIRLLLPLYTANLNLYKKGFKICFYYADNRSKFDFMHISTLQIFDTEERESFFKVLDFDEINDYPSEEALSKLSTLVAYGSGLAKQLLIEKIKKFFNDRNGDMIRLIVDREYIKYLEPIELDLLLENFDYTIITEKEPEDLNYDESSTRIEILGKYGYSKANMILKEEFFKKFKEDQLKGLEFLATYLSDLKPAEIEHLLEGLNYDLLINQQDPRPFNTLSWLAGLGISKAKQLLNQIYGPSSLINLVSPMGNPIQEISNEKKLNVLQSILEPSEFTFFKELQSLIGEDIKIQINPSNLESPSIVVKQKKITKIWMEAQNIEELPKSIGMLNSLNIVNLNNNHLKTLPKEIGSLTSLEKLSLRKNDITKLPRSIGKLIHLQELDLTRNKLTTLPPSITELKRLKTLYLNFNHLKNLPKKFGNFKSLEKLFCDYNQLKTLPETVHKLRNVKRIDLQGNKIKTIPRTLLSLNSLKIISLSRDYLDEESINLLESIKIKHSLFVRNADRNHLGQGGLTDKSEVEPLNILFGKHILQFYYEYGGLDPIIFWAANDETESKYGDPVRLDDLPLSDDIMEKLDSLYERYNLSYKQDDESDLKEFKNETRDTYLKVIKQLGSEFQVKFSMKGYDVPYEG